MIIVHLRENQMEFTKPEKCPEPAYRLTVNLSRDLPGQPCVTCIHDTTVLHGWHNTLMVGGYLLLLSSECSYWDKTCDIPDTACIRISL